MNSYSNERKSMDLNFLGGPQLAILQKALLSAFTKPELDQLLYHGDRDLVDNLVAPGSLKQQVFELIKLSQRDGWTDWLITSAIKQKPNNSQIRDLMNNLRMVEDCEASGPEGLAARAEGHSSFVAPTPVFDRVRSHGTVSPWFEDLPLDFTKQETRSAEVLLVAGLQSNFAAISFASNVGLNLATLNQMAPVQYLVHEMMNQARVSGRLPQLIAEVFNDPNLAGLHEKFRDLVAGYEGRIAAAGLARRPAISTLAALPSSLEAWASGTDAPQPLSQPGLEQIVNAAAGFADPATFRLRLAEAEVRTARIDIGGHPNGSGFLVGDNLLLTAWHVVAGIGNARATAVFDNRVSAQGRGVHDEGRAVAFADHWIVAKSANAPTAQEFSSDGPPEGWDFALVRLAEPVAAQAVGPDPYSASADRRGSYKLDGSAYLFQEAEPLFILGHPAGRPAQFSYASPSGAKRTKNENRVRYQTNTESGSSGSPVFNRSWRVVALHHAAGPTKVPGDFDLQGWGFNQGVPIGGIVAELKRQLAGKPEIAEIGLL